MRRILQVIFTTDEYNNLKTIMDITGRDRSECVGDALKVWLKKLTKEMTERDLNQDK